MISVAEVATVVVSLPLEVVARAPNRTRNETTGTLGPGGRDSPKVERHETVFG